MSSTAINSSDLDFNQIKTSLKSYLKAESEFADYDFEGSGLSNILDVLAYNTHINGLIANMGINESFLSSAQLRSSVVTHAENLGYYPRSKTASSANVQLSVSGSDTTTSTVTLEKNTKFTTTLDEVSYTFQTLEDYIATNDGAGNFQFKTSAGSSTIPISEGTLKTKTFLVGDTTGEQVYVIPDKTIDTTTITVSVFDTTTSSTSTTYVNVNDVARIDSTSTVYIVREAPNGFYDLIFSDGSVLGQSPTSGNKIEVKYLTSSGADANGASTFTPNAQISFGDPSVDYTLSVTTVSNSAGGDEKESIASIKGNAPLSFATQQRLVTAEDYRALIKSKYSSVISDVSAWGGNDNIPPVYGRVYVSLNFKDGITEETKTTTKNQIKTELGENIAIMSIDTIFSDPTNLFLELVTEFNFDPDLSGTTVETTEANVQATINDFISSNLNTFDKVFRRSQVLAEIDALSTAVLDSKMDVKMQLRFSPTVNILADYSLSYPVAIATNDDVEHRITSTSFTLDGQKCTLRNRLSSNTLEVINEKGDVIKDNAGSYNPTTGKVDITGFNPSAFAGSNIHVTATPANQATIRPIRNYIITIDTDVSFANAVLDYQNTAATIS